jgi:ABC-type tungstate transport system substrate-binding protein
MILAKANETLRKQVALKQDCSKRQCVSLAALMGMHVAFILLLFRRQKLWLQFALLGTASVPTVRL